MRATPSSRPRAWPATLAAATLAFVAWPVVWGWSPVHALGATAFLALFVWLPGEALLRWTLPLEDALERAFLALVAGLAVLGAVFLAACALDLRAATWALPPLAGAAWLAARRRPDAGGARVRPDAATLGWLALPLLVALLRARPEFPAEWPLGFGSDESFHVANAGELRWRWPLGSPFVAGEALRYHFLSYTAPAAMGTILGLPVRECMLGLTPHLAPLVFALGLFVLARAVGARAWVAAACALVLVLHTDLGVVVRRLTGSDWTLATPFSEGLYRSTTNAAGMCLLAGVLLVLHVLLVRRESVRGATVLLLLLAAATSATKASVLPPVIAGLWLALAWGWLRGQRAELRPLAGPIVVMVLASAPMTVWLLGDSGGYASAMFRWIPLAALRTCGFGHRAVELLGLTGAGEHASAVALHAPLVALAWTPLWLVLFFGVASLGLVAWLGARERPLPVFQRLLASTVVVGLVPAVLLGAPGWSQLFFGYVSVVAAVVLTALGLQRTLERGGRAASVARVALLGGLAVFASGAFLREVRIPRPRAVSVGAADAYRAAVEWIRTHLPRDAVLVADDVRTGLDTWSERRLYYATARFLPQFHSAWSPLTAERGRPARPDPFADRIRAQQDLLHSPSAQTLARVRAHLAEGTPLYAVRSGARLDEEGDLQRLSVPPRRADDPLAALPGAELVFANEAVAVYRLP